MSDNCKEESSFIKFLGTAGARFVMIKQLRSSAGIWLKFKSTNIIIDPGPGAIVRCNNSRPKLDPTNLDGIILTHKHIDHSNDVNVMVEAMTEGGFKKRGKLIAPTDSFGPQGVVFSYLQEFPQEINILKQGKYSIKDVNFEVPLRNKHTVETYGLKFFLGKEIVSFVSDTKYFDDLIGAYSDSTILILNVVFAETRDDYDHLSLDQAIHLVKMIKPKKCIFTHFGMGILRSKPHLIEKKIKEELDCVKFAYDGFTLEILSD